MLQKNLECTFVRNELLISTTEDHKMISRLLGLLTGIIKNNKTKTETEKYIRPSHIYITNIHLDIS